MKRIIQWWKSVHDGSGSHSFVVDPPARRDEDCIDGEWHYSILAKDGKTQLTITVQVRPEYATYGSDITLHTNFTGSTDAKRKTSGGFICVTDYKTSSTAARDMVQNTYGSMGRLSSPSENFWKLLEAKFHEWDKAARDEYEREEIQKHELCVCGGTYEHHSPQAFKKMGHVVTSAPAPTISVPAPLLKFDPAVNESQVIWSGVDQSAMRSVRIVAQFYPRREGTERLFVVEVPLDVSSAAGRNWIEAPPELAARVLGNVLFAQLLNVKSAMTEY